LNGSSGKIKECKYGEIPKKDDYNEWYSYVISKEKSPSCLK